MTEGDVRDMTHDINKREAIAIIRGIVNCATEVTKAARALETQSARMNNCDSPEPCDEAAIPKANSQAEVREFIGRSSLHNSGK